MKTYQFILQLFLFIGLVGISNKAFVANDHKHQNSLNKTHNILFVAARHSNKAKVNLLKKQAKTLSGIGHLNIEAKSEKDLGELPEALTTFDQYDLVILDSASSRTAKQTYSKYSSIIPRSPARILTMKLPEDKGFTVNIDSEKSKTLAAYYKNGGVENFNRMAQYLLFRVFNSEKSRVVAEPIIYPAIGIYHPDNQNLIFPDRETYINWKGAIKPNQQVIGLNIQRSAIEANQTVVIDQTISALEKKGIYTIPYFFELSPRITDYSSLIQNKHADGTIKTIVDTIINFRTIHWANQRKAEFNNFGVPVIQALSYYSGDKKQWEESEQGISAGMMAFTLVLPESAGVIDPTVIAANNLETGQVEIIDYQLDFLLDRALAHTKLKYIPNQEKKITTMFWGDRDMGASFLNVPESLRAMSHRLNNEGYKVNKVDADFFIDRVDRILNPFYRDFELEALLEDDLADLLPLKDYLSWLSTIPKAFVDPINKKWGKAEDNFMITEKNGEKYFVIPRIRNGNMLVMRQPPRGDSKDKEQGLYHTTTVPINHYYLAAYFYAREFWQSDAFIHLGTHGSHEYLPGKERGLSRYDGGNLTSGKVPIFYPFIVDDVGEAMQTKRRGNATVISHMTPPFAAAGLQGVTSDIHELMHQYKMLDEGGVKRKTGEQIAEQCIAEKLCEDMDYDLAKINSGFETFLDDLHDYLAELASQNQPLGLHSFGEPSEQRLIISTIGQMLGEEFAEKAADFEHAFYSHSHGGHGHHHGNGHKEHSHDDHSHSSNKSDNDVYHHSGEELEEIPGFKLIRDFAIGTNDLKKLGKELRPFVEKAKKHFSNIVGLQELDKLIAGLSGKYIDVKNGGDPIRHPESLPTGFNLIGFDPARLPTKAAYEQGQELVEDVINNYQQKHGKFPDKLAFSLWSIEAMRHYGVLESQALYAMGVKPTWSRDGRVTGTEIIPASELKRPRIDVVLSATGLYRDAFPNVMLRLAKAIKEVAKLKEEGNSIWTNSQKVKKQLLAEGVKPDEAQYLSTVRIFSNASGDYGSGVDGPVMASETWETDAKIANNYLARMGYYFGDDESRWGKQVENLYAKHLSGTDAALFSRSSNIYGMITSDDPFEYFGSLALAVRNIDGESPEMMVSNLRDVKKVKMEMAANFMAKELRTRNFHKRWITEMKREGYSGAVSMASSVANFWGWQVVDPNVVRDDQWQEFHDIYVEDKLNLGLNEWFEAVNPGAQAQLIERMLEAIRKEYWQANDAVIQTLIERYTELVQKYDYFVDNEKLKEFVNQQATGFGLDTFLADQTNLDAIAQTPENAAAKQQIEGQQLEKVEQTQSDTPKDFILYWLLLACLMVFICGIGWQSFSHRLSFANNLQTA